jgi:cation diffusion facilitator CzcD-associated flavoprotein CzcO
MTTSSTTERVAAASAQEALGDQPRHVAVLIVGSGFAGLGAAIRLERAGHHDFLVIERGPEVGGTWRDNTYPGAACDVPSHLYSFSFAQNPSWTRSFSTQPEIQAYLRRTAQTSGTLDRHLFDCELLAARWEAASARWVVRTSRGAFTADMLVTAFGALCEPALPDIPGIASFAGEVFHSSRWDHATSLAGKRVAVIGTGASSIQLVPQIAQQVAHLDVYQRTAPWVMPRRDRAYSRLERLAFARVPGFQRLSRGLIYAGRELTAIGFSYRPQILKMAQKQALRHLHAQISDPALRAAVTPAYTMGCKRVLLSNDYYPALARDTVEVVTTPIASVQPDGVVTSDERLRPVDVLIVATGFHVTDSPAADLIEGADGRTLGAHYRDVGQQAYKGIATAGFPNLFTLVGPNTGLGHTSMIYMIESQLNYLVAALGVVRDQGLSTVEVRQQAQDRYNEDLQRRMRRTVWTTGGCASWYLDEQGRNTTLWPGFTFAFRAITRRFDLESYNGNCVRQADRQPRS